MSAPIPSFNLCGDSPCGCGSLCDFKILCGYIPPVATADDTGSYCPGTYNLSTGEPITACNRIANICAWLNSQWGDFQNDSLYPWNTFTSASFTHYTDASPASINGPPTAPGVTASAGGPTYFNGYGNVDYGSTYVINYPLVAKYGISGGGSCAFAQILAMRMDGNLFITPFQVPSGEGGETDLAEPCEEPNPLGTYPGGVYYIPLPPYDLCYDPSGGGIQVAYVPSQTGNSTACLPDYDGGAYATCQNPDPFFGSDPP